MVSGFVICVLTDLTFGATNVFVGNSIPSYDMDRMVYDYEK